MDYNSNHSYGIAYCAMLLVLSPFMFIIDVDKWGILLFPAIIVGNEYSFSFLRQAMKLYEEIIFKSLLERFTFIIQLLMIVGIGTCDVYSYKTNNFPQLFIFLLIYYTWYILIQSQSLIIGGKSIGVGRKVFSYDSIDSIELKNNGLFIEAKGKSFTIHNWTIGKDRYSLEAIVKNISENLIV